MCVRVRTKQLGSWVDGQEWVHANTLTHTYAYTHMHIHTHTYTHRCDLISNFDLVQVDLPKASGRLGVPN